MNRRVESAFGWWQKVEVIRKIDDLYKKQKIRADYDKMMAASIIKIAELIGAIPSRGKRSR